MHSRRGFLGLLGGFAAAAVLDPERLLWVPGQKMISIPSPAETWMFAQETGWQAVHHYAHSVALLLEYTSATGKKIRTSDLTAVFDSPPRNGLIYSSWSDQKRNDSVVG